jgi:hypothetical protein
MKLYHFAWLILCLAAPVCGQDAASPAATPPPLPPPPWLKKAPPSSQWLVAYTRGEAATKPASGRQGPLDATSKKSVVVTKTPDVISETTARLNGSVVRRFSVAGLTLAQVGDTPWVAASGYPQSSFSETDYIGADFAGFGWIAEKNYVGVQAVATRPCLVFHDKVMTADPQEIDLIRITMQQQKADWQNRQSGKVQKQVHPTVTGSGSAGKQSGKGSQADAAADETPPPDFNPDNYKRDVTAYIDAESGMPVLLTYKTQRNETETRSYTFLATPTSPLVLPPEAQLLVDQNQTRLRRISSPAAAP